MAVTHVYAPKYGKNNAFVVASKNVISLNLKYYTVRFELYVANLYLTLLEAPLGNKPAWICILKLYAVNSKFEIEVVRSVGLKLDKGLE